MALPPRRWADLLSSDPAPDIQDLIDRFRARDRAALARAISLVEGEREGFEILLHEALKGCPPRGDRLGITGPPGAGKSTLAATLAGAYRERDEEVAVVAVDPTSPYSGGALLGDRIRMNEVSLDGGVFIRSMASRGAPGGLALMTREVTDLLDAFGFPRIIVETVGVGQTQVEISDAVDTVVVVLVPESGDAVQTMKAGLMEVGDVFVVNKADRPDADRLVTELRRSLESEPGSSPTSRVVSTVARTGEGVADLVAAIDEHGAWLEESGELDARRRRRVELRVRNVLQRSVQALVWADPRVEARVADGLSAIRAGTETPYSIARGVLGLVLGRPAGRSDAGTPP